MFDPSINRKCVGSVMLDIGWVMKIMIWSIFTAGHEFIQNIL